MKPRFEPSQEVWTPYKNRALCVDIMEILWKEDEIEYEIQTISELGHQAFETYADTEEKNCILFKTKEDCEKWISNDFDNVTFANPLFTKEDIELLRAKLNSN